MNPTVLRLIPIVIVAVRTTGTVIRLLPHIRVIYQTLRKPNK